MRAYNEDGTYILSSHNWVMVLKQLMETVRDIQSVGIATSQGKDTEFGGMCLVRFRVISQVTIV